MEWTWRGRIIPIKTSKRKMSRFKAAVSESREVFLPPQFWRQSNRAILAGSEAGSSHYRDKFSYFMAPAALIIAFEQRRAAIVSYCDACIVRHGHSTMALTTCTNVYVDVCVSCWHANFSVLCPALIIVYTSLYVDVCWYGDELGSRVDVNNFSALCPAVINVYMYGNHAIRCILIIMCSSLYVDVCINYVSCYHDGELWSHDVCGNAFTNDLCAYTCPACLLCLPDVCPVFICVKSYCIIVFSCTYTCVQYMHLLLLCCGDVELNPGPSARQKWEKQRKYYVEHKNEILTKRKDTYKKVQIKQKLPDVLTTVANVRMRELIVVLTLKHSMLRILKQRKPLAAFTHKGSMLRIPRQRKPLSSCFYSQRQYAEDPEAKKAFSALYAKKICCQSRTKKNI